MQYLLLVVGLVLIIKGADVLIDSAAKIARRYGVSSFVIGITVVAFGTSAPELAVGIVSGISKTNQLALGNIIGSSFSNTALIVGLASVIMALRVEDKVVRREIPMLIIIQLILAAMLVFDGRLSRLDGAILIAGFAAFMLYKLRTQKNQ
jgi:cation:H+ antiporter